MRNLKVMGRALLDVYESMFSLLLANLVWALLASLPASAMLSLLNLAADTPESTAGLEILLFLSGLILVLLTGPASYSLAVMMRRVTELEAVGVRDFLSGMRQHFRRGWLMGLVSLVGLGMLWVNLRFYATLGGWALAALPLFLILTAFWLIVMLYLYPMAVITEGGPRRVIRNCLVLILRHPGLSLSAGIMALIILVLSTALIIPWLILTMGALTAIGTRAVRSAVRRDLGLPEEDPLDEGPLPPILAEDNRQPLPHYGWRNARRDVDETPE